MTDSLSAYCKFVILHIVLVELLLFAIVVASCAVKAGDRKSVV